MTEENDGRFCPKCGATNKTFVENFCIDCYLHDHTLVDIPAKIELPYCAHCKKVFLKGKWTEPSEAHLELFLKSKVKIKDLYQTAISASFVFDEMKALATLTVSGVLNESVIDIVKAIELQFKKNTCDACSRVSGGYFEAILQIRLQENARKDALDDAFKEVSTLLILQEKKEPLSRIVNLERSKQGIDVYIGSKHAAKVIAEKIAARHNSKTVTSYTLHGLDRTGNEVHRFTYCVRVK
jgi:nonsense-mediated mRNA decay protein 3